MVGAGGLQGDPGGVVVGEGGEEGLTAFRGVGEAEAGGFGGVGDEGQVQVGFADVNAGEGHGLSPFGNLREVATRPCGPSMWMRSLTTGILCGGDQGQDTCTRSSNRRRERGPVLRGVIVRNTHKIRPEYLTFTSPLASLASRRCARVRDDEPHPRAARVRRAV